MTRPLDNASASGPIGGSRLPSPCPFCGHAHHPNARCAGTSDEGRYPCACSFPDPDNFAEVPA